MDEKEQIIKQATECYEKSLKRIFIVEPTEENFEQAARAIKALNPLMIGLDTKTQQGSSMASVVTLGLSGGPTYIFPVKQYSDNYENMSDQLKAVLQTPHIIKCTFDTVARSQALRNYGITLDGCIDIRCTARVRGFHKTGVEGLTAALFRTAYHRHPHKRQRKKYMQAKWEEKISSNMAEYVASRAHLTIRIYVALCELPIQPYQPEG